MAVADALPAVTTGRAALTRSPFPRRHPPKSFTSPLVSGTADNEHSIFAKVRLVRWFCLMLHVWLIALVVNSRRLSRGQRTSNHTVEDQI